MRYNQIVRAKEGTQRHIVEVDEVKIPDLWHTIDAVRDHAKGESKARLTAKQADMVYETWTLCHDLLKHIKRICKEQ